MLIDQFRMTPNSARLWPGTHHYIEVFVGNTIRVAGEYLKSGISTASFWWYRKNTASRDVFLSTATHNLPSAGRI